ncbi:MAG: choice-of-anchor tandem repeat GloVer-containing protein [Verrucomicrobiota bacterium]|jgi:uncharacterized repeat protein (TIGR03803 family)
MKTKYITRRSTFVAVAILSCVCLTASAQDYRVLHHFTGNANDGAAPDGGLIQSGSTFYGMTYGGGSSGNGVIFEINTDGTGFQLLHSFAGGANDGAGPLGSLIQSGPIFYGMTYGGGSGGNGTVFQLNTNGSGFSVMHQFAVSEGMWSYGDSLIQSGINLYGTCTAGGSAYSWSGNGTVFSISTNDNSCRVLHTFTGAPSDGRSPYASLIQSGATLYGTTSGGGSSGHGTVFQIDTNGTPYRILHNFTGGSNDGSTPYMNKLILSGPTLYGATYAGGSNNHGTVFQLNTNGTFSLLHSFSVSDGQNPDGGLILSGSTLYGMTSYGGIGGTGGDYTGNGVIYQINTNGSGFQLLHRFTGSDGQNPSGSLLLSGSTLYGMTEQGGSHSQGVIFALDLFPKLTVALNDTNLNLSWSTNYPDFTLESTGDLTGGWTSVPGVTGYSATLPVSADSQFFRLRK